MKSDLFTSLQSSFNELWNDVITFIPEIVIAILIVVAGFIVGGILKGITERIFSALKLNDALDKAGLDTLTERAGHSFKPGQFVGSLVKWFVVVVFVVAALDVLRLSEVTTFFSEEVLTYIPRVIVAAFILLGSILVAQVVSKSVEAGARAGGFKSASLVGSFTRYAILVFAVLAALSQLQIAADLVQTLFAGMVFGLALAFGLAFGLGGKDTASRYLSKLEGEVNGRSSHPNER